MSDNFTGHNHIAKLTGETINEDYFHTLNDVNIDDLTLSYDHMYASSNSIVNGIEATEQNCQNSDDEVKFLKEWLVIHLDLIQQQSEEILRKEKTIFILKQENEKLKERLHCFEKDISIENNQVELNRTEININTVGSPQDMTKDLATNAEQNYKLDRNIDALFNFVDHNEKHLNCTVTNNEYEAKLEDLESHDHIIKSPSYSHRTDTLDSKYEGSYTIHNSTENDSMKNLKMSIRRKRLCSNSSAFSNNDSASDDKKNRRRIKKRRKKSLTSENILMCSEQYVTHAGETNLSIINPLDLGPDLPPNARTNNLEVPRWRIKSYTSCYTMEGTENLEDEVFNKRHSRLEYDERRRKRWDVQRIREQRIIDKLKLRQDKVGSNSRNEDSDPLDSLWPVLDDIKFVEVSDTLPVTSFGSPVPRIQSSDFCLPWINHQNSTTSRRRMAKRSRAKRRGNGKR